jgi:hypothetical protein
LFVRNIFPNCVVHGTGWGSCPAVVKLPLLTVSFLSRVQSLHPYNCKHDSNLAVQCIICKGKGKVVPVLWAPPHGVILGELRYSSTHSLTSALDGGEWSASRPGRFTPRERAPGTHWVGVRYAPYWHVFRDPDKMKFINSWKCDECFERWTWFADLTSYTCSGLYRCYSLLCDLVESHCKTFKIKVCMFFCIKLQNLWRNFEIPSAT